MKIGYKGKHYEIPSELIREFEKQAIIVETKKLKAQHEKELKEITKKDHPRLLEWTNILEEENQSLKKLFVKKNGNKLGQCNWAVYCSAVKSSRNQCSKKNCIIYDDCLIRKLEKELEDLKKSCKMPSDILRYIRSKERALERYHAKVLRWIGKCKFKTIKHFKEMGFSEGTLKLLENIFEELKQKLEKRK